jgi:hypothetical protein
MVPESGTYDLYDCETLVSQAIKVAVSIDRTFGKIIGCPLVAGKSYRLRSLHVDGEFSIHVQRIGFGATGSIVDFVTGDR